MSDEIQIDLSWKGVMSYILFLVRLMIEGTIFVLVLLYLLSLGGISVQDIIMKLAGI